MTDPRLSKMTLIADERLAREVRAEAARRAKAAGVRRIAMAEVLRELIRDGLACGREARR